MSSGSSADELTAGARYIILTAAFLGWMFSGFQMAVMTLAALAPICSGPTRILNVANIRIKETDRLAATVAELERLGQRVTHGEDWLAVEPRPVRAATVQCYDDHRMAMSFAVLGAVRAGVSIENPACVAKTYPGFWRDLELAYGPVADGLPRRDR